MNELDKLKMNLQFFAEPPADTPPGEQTPPDDEPITLTAKELQSKLDAEAEKRVAKVTAKKEAEWQSKFDEMLEERLQEKERLAKLSEKERKEEELTQREKKAIEREQAIALKELRADALEEITTKGIPTSFVDFLVREDAESTLATINDFKEKWDASIAEELKRSAQQDIPKDSVNFTGQTSVTKSIRDFANKNRIIKGE